MKTNLKTNTTGMDEKSEKIVNELSDYINGSCRPKEFCNAMSREHRYLQNEFTLLCIEWLRTCGSDNYRYDGRNEGSHNFGKMLIDKGLKKNKKRGCVI